MTEGSELRGFVVVLLVSVAIAIAFVVISAIDPTEQELVAGTTSTTSSTTTTTVVPLTEEDRLELLCRRAEEFVAEIEPFRENGVLVSRAAENFYVEVVELAPADVRPEYEAALDHYTDFNDIGDPFAYDTEKILLENEELGRRWEQLVTREPFAVDATRAHIGFACGVVLPEAYTEDPEDFEKIKVAVDRVLNPERYERPPTTTAPEGGGEDGGGGGEGGPPAQPPATQPPATQPAAEG